MEVAQAAKQEMARLTPTKTQDREPELRTVCSDFASVAQNRFDVRHAVASMEQIFSALVDSEKRANLWLGRV